MEKRIKKYACFITIFYLFFLPISPPCQEAIEIEAITEYPDTRAGGRVINEHNEHQTEEIDNDTDQSKYCSFSTIWNVGDRVVKSNNRSLGTLFGCVAGGVAATTLVATNSHASFQIFGDPSSVPLKICGILLSVGVGGNLSSYIGASIDILTGEKTIFDAIRYLKNCCLGKPEVPHEEEILETQVLSAQPPSAHRHYPFITANKAALEEHRRYSKGQEENLVDNEVLEHLLSIYHDSINKQTQIDELLKEVTELRSIVNQT